MYIFTFWVSPQIMNKSCIRRIVHVFSQDFCWRLIHRNSKRRFYYIILKLNRVNPEKQFLKVLIIINIVQIKSTSYNESLFISIYLSIYLLVQAYTDVFVSEWVSAWCLGLVDLIMCVCVCLENALIISAGNFKMNKIGMLMWPTSIYLWFNFKWKWHKCICCILCCNPCLESNAYAHTKW